MDGEREEPGLREALRRALQDHGWYVADVVTTAHIESSDWAPVIVAAYEDTPENGYAINAALTEAPPSESLDDPELETLMAEQRAEDEADERLHAEMDAAGYDQR